MSYPQTSDTVPLPIPIKGMNRRDPLSAMEPYYAEWILNFEPESQYLRLRNGIVIHANMSTKCTAVLGLGAYGTSKLFVYTQDSTTPTNNSIWDVTSAGVPVAAVEVTDSGVADEAYPVKFNKRFVFATETDWDDNARLYDSSWADWGFTYDPGTGAATIGGRTVVSYKGRVYIFSFTDMYYSTLAAVTGATTLVDLESLFEEDGEIVWAGVITSPSNRSDELFLAFGNQAGEILVYAGDNPAAANWEQVGRFKTSPPLYYNSVLQFNNDIWIATQTGVVSLRGLFESGNGGSLTNTDIISPSVAINPYWIQIASASNTWGHTRCSMAYWPEKNKVYVLMQGHVSDSGIYSSTSATLFSYNAFTGAWIPSLILDSSASPGVSSLTYFNNGLYFLNELSTSEFVMKVSTGFKDEVVSSPGTYLSITPSLRTAYTNLGNNSIHKQIVGFEGLIKTDVATLTSYSSTDFGRSVSAANVLPLSASGGYQRFLSLCGNRGTYLQYRIGGMATTTSTTGFELYSLGVIVK